MELLWSRYDAAMELWMMEIFDPSHGLKHARSEAAWTQGGIQNAAFFALKFEPVLTVKAISHAPAGMASFSAFRS